MTTQDIENYTYQYAGNNNKMHAANSAEKRYQTGKTWIKGIKNVGAYHDSLRSTLTPQTIQSKIGFRNIRNPFDDKRAKLSVRNQSQETLIMPSSYQK